MITRNEKMLWLLLGAILVLLFLLSSTDLIIKEEEKRIYPISVIVEDDGDANYVNFQKGMDQAAMERNADVSFITLYETGNAEQQQALALREQEDGAAALVVVPAGEQGASDILAARSLIPMVTVWADGTDAGAVAAVTTDFAGMGKNLADKIGKDWAAGVPVYLFVQEQEKAAAREFGEALAGRLAENGFYPRLIRKEGYGTFRNALEDLRESGIERAVLAGLDPDSLTELSAILEGDEALFACVGALYGRGSTLSLLNSLDRGIIRGLCVTDEFSAGYISVWQAVEAAEGHVLGKRTVLESYYIEKEDLRKSEYEKMLYPIE